MTQRDFRASAIRYAVGPALIGCLALACSSTPPPPPDAFVALTLGPYLDASQNNLCNYATVQPVLSIGNNSTGGSPGPQTKADSSQQPDGNVSVTCTVRGSFDVSLTSALGGTSGGSLQISGHVTAGSGGSSIAASFTSNGLSYTETDCTIAFTYHGAPVPASPPIAAGRIWAHLKCPSMANPSHQKVLANGMQVSEMCDGEADFLFDNCSQ